VHAWSRAPLAFKMCNRRRNMARFSGFKCELLPMESCNSLSPKALACQHDVNFRASETLSLFAPIAVPTQPLIQFDRRRSTKASNSSLLAARNLCGHSGPRETHSQAWPLRLNNTVRLLHRKLTAWTSNPILRSHRAPCVRVSRGALTHP